MFTRTSTHVLNAAKAELKKQGVRYTAQSKKNRIQVQLLKNFPGVGVKGQIVAVKPSAMTNQFYPNNGAVYMNFEGAEPRIPIVTKADAAQAAAILKAEAKKAKAVKPKAVKTEKKEVKKPSLLSLDDLLSIDLNTLAADQLDLIFAKIPKKLVLVRPANDSILKFDLEKSFLTQQIETILARYIVESDLVIKFFNNESTSFVLRSATGEAIESIEKLGNYYLDVKHGDKEQQIAIIVNNKS